MFAYFRLLVVLFWSKERLNSFGLYLLRRGTDGCIDRMGWIYRVLFM